MCVNKRLLEVRQNVGLSQEAFGERIGLKKSAVSLIENGRNGTTDQTIKSICREFHVREQWLRTGEGEMYEEAAPDDVSAFLAAKGIRGLEADLFRAYLSLPKALRTEFLNYFQRYFDDKAAGQTQSEAPPGTAAEGGKANEHK